MPPKSKKNETSKKTEQKRKEKVIEDKTFGMKNKKGTKQQKFIKMVNQQVLQPNQKGRMEREEAERKRLKEQKQKEKEALNLLFRPVEQKVGKGVDPKSILCAFFKQGLCKKGEKCKFSHDLTIGRKAEKRNIYEDQKDDNMDDWDEQKLEEVVNKKHGSANKSMPKTTIICKYFLDAVENSKYGWFWSCPNGENCHYRHALPQGFVLKKDKKKMEENKEEISLEDLVERERAALSSSNLTKVTLQTFLRWKEQKKKEKQEKLKITQDKKKSDFKSGKILGVSGRELFEFNPDLIQGDDEEADKDILASYRTQNNVEDGDETQEDTYDGPVRELTLDTLAAEAKEADGSGTQKLASTLPKGGTTSKNITKNSSTKQDEASKLDEAAALPSDADVETDLAIQSAMAATVNGDTIADAPIDENLFDGDDIELIDEELETLDLND